MTAQAHTRASWRLMRPAQWPILSTQLLVGLLLAAPTAGPARTTWIDSLNGWRLGEVWFTWIVLLNGCTLAFNSAYDRDTGPIAYLASPPAPPPHLARYAGAGMVTGVVLGGVLVSPSFGALLGGCTILSWLYSHPSTRWKSRPGLDLAVNMVGYGAGTTLAGLTASASGITNEGWWFTAGFGLLFGSFYPLTQIYQFAADQQRGDSTLTTALGVRPALTLAGILGLLAACAFWQACPNGIWTAAIFLWEGHLTWWWWRAKSQSDAGHEKAMYRALGLWALVDITLSVAWLVQPASASTLTG